MNNDFSIRKIFNCKLKNKWGTKVNGKCEGIYKIIGNQPKCIKLTPKAFYDLRPYGEEAFMDELVPIKNIDDYSCDISNPDHEK